MLIFGNGIDADRFLYKHQLLLQDVDCFVTSGKAGTFHGKEVKILDESVKSTDQIIVSASRFETYQEIADLLDDKGYREFKNYTWTHMYGKKIVVVNANCHGSAIIKYLNLSPKFRKEYFVYPVEEIQNNKKGFIPEKLLNNADVYIHQDIREENKYSFKLADSYIKRRLKNNCIDISVPNFVGMAFFMFPNLGNFKPRNGVDFYSDIVLDEAIEKVDHTFAMIQKYWKEYDFGASILDEYFEKDMEKIKRRQKNWDVPVYDYIINNYRKVPCFVDFDHPSRYLMKHIGRYVANVIGVDDINDEDYYSGLGGVSSPVIDCVKQHFKIEYEFPVETKAFLGNDISDLENEYIKNYCWWYHDVSL